MREDAWTFVLDDLRVERARLFTLLEAVTKSEHLMSLEAFDVRSRIADVDLALKVLRRIADHIGR
jgi:hypothetical protein